MARRRSARPSSRTSGHPTAERWRFAQKTRSFSSLTTTVPFAHERQLAVGSLTAVRRVAGIVAVAVIWFIAVAPRSISRRLTRVDRVVGEVLHQQLRESRVAARDRVLARDAPGPEDGEGDEPLRRLGREGRLVAPLVGVRLRRGAETLARPPEVVAPEVEQAEVVERRVEIRVETDRLAEVALGDVRPLLECVGAADEVVHLGRRAERERALEVHERLLETALDRVQAPEAVVRDERVLAQPERPLEVLARRV